jgi:putative ABC transport system permease protein
MDAVEPRNWSCLFVALANLLQHRTRLFVALIGTGVPIVLVCLQLAVLDAAREEVTRLYNDFGFDLALVPSAYQFLNGGATFDRVRFTQARAVDGVAATFSLNVRASNWTEDATKRLSTLLLIGVDDDFSFVRDPEIRSGLQQLPTGRSVLVDDYSSSDYGPLATGSAAAISGEMVEIAGRFRLGLFFYADGSAIVRNTDFATLAKRDARQTSVGLMRLEPGANRAAVMHSLARVLPADVRVLTRDAFIDQEQAFFISTKPIGIMLAISVWIAFIAGSVILLQVISADVINRIKEFATLKAMGFSPLYVFGIGAFEAAMLAFGAFVPAFLAAAIILFGIEKATHLPTVVTPRLAVTVLAIALPMCLLSAVVALRRIARAAPAELYR